jgi:hypothetical protein
MAIHEFPMPADVNGEQLKNEIGAESVYQIEDNLFIVGDMTKAEAQSALSAHKPLKPTIQEKLASVGLSVDDLKAALGLS